MIVANGGGSQTPSPPPPPTPSTPAGPPPGTPPIFSIFPPGEEPPTSPTTPTPPPTPSGWIIPGGIDPASGGFVPGAWDTTPTPPPTPDGVDFSYPTPPPTYLPPGDRPPTTPPPSTPPSTGGWVMPGGIDPVSGGFVPGTWDTPPSTPPSTPPPAPPSGPIYELHETPSIEASREYARLYGSIPKTGASEEEKAFYKQKKAEIQAAMEAGTYVSPLSIPSPYIQELAEKYNISYRSAEAEARRMAEVATSALTYVGCAPFGLTEGEVKGAIAYYEQRNLLDRVNAIKEFYVATASTPGSFVNRAEAIEFGPFGTLREYKVEGGYNLGEAIASIPEGADRENFIRELGTYFPEGAIATGLAYASVRGTVGVGEVTIGTLAAAYAAGEVTEGDISAVYGGSVAEEVVNYQEMFPHGIGAEIGVTPTSKFGERRAYTATEIADMKERFPLLTDAAWKLIEEGKVAPPAYVERGSHEWRFMPTAEDPKWIRGLYWGSVGLLGVAGGLAFLPAVGGLAGAALPGGVAVGIGAGLPTLGIGGGVAGVGKLATVLAKPILKTGATFAGISAAAAGIYGAVTPPKEETWKQTQRRMYEEYLASPAVQAEIARIESEGKTAIPPTFGEYREAMGVEYTPLAYQEGIAGVFGRGWEAQTEFFRGVAGESPWYHPRSLAAGFMGYLASPALAAEIYSYKGPVAVTAAIPHFGPTAISPFLTGAPAWQKAVGIGFAVLPYATGPIGSALRGAGRFAAKVPVLSTFQKGLVGIGKGVGWAGEVTGISPLLTTFERVAPWQLAYTTSGLVGKIIPVTSGLGIAGKTWGWWGRSKPTPIREIWREWGQKPALGFGEPIEPVTAKSLKAQKALEYHQLLEAEVAAGRMVKITDPTTGRVVYKSYGQEYLPGFGPEGAAGRYGITGLVGSGPKPIPEPPLTGKASYFYRTQIAPWVAESAPAAPLTGQYYLPGWGPKGVPVSAPTTAPAPAAEWYSPYAQVVTYPAPVVEAPYVSQTFMQQLSGLLRPTVPALRMGLPAVATIGALAMLPVGTAIATPTISQVQIDIDTATNLLDKGVITQQQYDQLAEVIQEAQEANLSQSMFRQQVEQTVQNILNEQQQQQYFQEQQQQQTLQTSPLEQLQQAQQQVYQVPYQAPWEFQFEQQWEQDWITQPGPYEEEIRPPKAGGEELPPVFPWFPLWRARGAASYPRGKGMKKLLAGGQWIMPGLILSMPDPFGTGRQRIQLARKRARRYGAREARPMTGGLRV